jgi:hypothetical protein
MALHHVFELGNGVGLVWQPELGLAGAGALWGVQIPLWAAVAARAGKRFDRILAAMSGIAFGGAVVHFFIWPWRRNRVGLPVLTEAEGLPPSRLPAYTALLYMWGAVSVLSLREFSAHSRKWAILGLAAMPLLRRSATYHFTWLRDQAAANPAWWNRGVR